MITCNYAHFVIVITYPVKSLQTDSLGNLTKSWIFPAIEQSDCCATMEVIVSVFTDAQQSAAYHKNCIRKLTGLLTKASAAECQEYMNIILRGCIDPCLLMTKKEVGMDRVCKFYCDFLNTASTFSEPTIFRLGVEHFLVRSQATDKNVRSKACQYLSRVILSLGTDRSLIDVRSQTIS